MENTNGHARPAHDLYKTGDADAPEAILDRNGEVVLSLCRVCGQGEGDLEPECPYALHESGAPAQEKAEPVAYRIGEGGDQQWSYYSALSVTPEPHLAAGLTVEPLYTAPPAERVMVPDAFRALIEACEAEFCSRRTEEFEPDDSKVSFPEDKCHNTFGHIRRAREALSAAPEAGHE